MFEPEEQEQIRDAPRRTRCAGSSASGSLPKIGGGRIAVLEIMGNNLRTKEPSCTGESEGKSFYEIIEASQTFGWRTFDQASSASTSGHHHRGNRAPLLRTRAVVTRGIDNIKKKRGEKTTDVEGLTITATTRGRLNKNK